MVKIVIENLGKKELQVNDLTRSVLQHLQGHFIDWMHSCGGKGRCTSCKMILLKGAHHVSQPTAAEIKYQQEGLLADGERLTCQTRISGDIEVRVPDESKLPHMHYSS